MILDLLSLLGDKAKIIQAAGRSLANAG